MLKLCIILHPCLRFEVLRLAKTPQESWGAGFQNIVCLSGYRPPPLQTSLRLKATAERQRRVKTELLSFAKFHVTVHQTKLGI